MKLFLCVKTFNTIFFKKFYDNRKFSKYCKTLLLDLPKMIVMQASASTCFLLSICNIHNLQDSIHGISIHMKNKIFSKNMDGNVLNGQMGLLISDQLTQNGHILVTTKYGHYNITNIIS
jgi:hypothetical protein